MRKLNIGKTLNITIETCHFCEEQNKECIENEIEFTNPERIFGVDPVGEIGVNPAGERGGGPEGPGEIGKSSESGESVVYVEQPKKKGKVRVCYDCIRQMAEFVHKEDNEKAGFRFEGPKKK